MELRKRAELDLCAADRPRTLDARARSRDQTGRDRREIRGTSPAATAQKAAEGRSAAANTNTRFRVKTATCEPKH